jgi:pimeloyl-ACP methyl ester carboxylesterase
MTALVIFTHGKESGPWGSKIRFLASIAERFGARVISPDYSDLSDPDFRVRRLLDMPLNTSESSPLVLVGSSMGGYVSCVATETLRPAGLFLLAPAIGMPGYAVQAPLPHAPKVEIVMGWRDEVVPPQNVIVFAQTHRTTLHLLDTDHRLNEVLPEVGALFEHFLYELLSSHKTASRLESGHVD